LNVSWINTAGVGHMQVEKQDPCQAGKGLIVKENSGPSRSGEVPAARFSDRKILM
jgi:hypothetical protein